MKINFNVIFTPSERVSAFFNLKCTIVLLEFMTYINENGEANY